MVKVGKASWLIVAVALVGMLVTGCSATPPPSPSQGTMPAGAIGISASPRSDGKSERDITYISPAKIEIENLFPGATGEFELEIHNGKNIPCTFSVTARPGDTEPPFEPMPEEFLTWVHIPEAMVLVPPKESKFLTIAVTMPPDATVRGKKYEFLVVVKDTTQTGFIQVELALRVMVSTQ